jgi:dihydrofolate reductase
MEWRGRPQPHGTEINPATRGQLSIVIVTLIAALDEDGAIGRLEGGVPWHLPDESAHFRACCAGQWLLVGRRTYEEMTGWFQPEHHVLVLTRQPLISSQTAALPAPSTPPRAVRQVSDALALARQAAADQLIVLGGAETYRAALPFADRLILSRIHQRTGAAVHFPPLPVREWRLHHSESPRIDRTTGIPFTIQHWERHSPPT